MHTLVLLSALAAIATAAPTLPESRYSEHRPSYQITPTFRREKKSPVEAHDDAVSMTELNQNFPRSELNNAHEVSGRTFESKKPIIVKNKSGYHLFRDSNEEQAQADSQEKCTKEVKVKLCDEENRQAKSSNMKESFASGEDNIHQSENEMERSIKMAKETVENLQKMSHWKHSEFGPDAEIHKDIEIARQALAHVQKNFDNLESMNTRNANLNDAVGQDTPVRMTNEERMAQWKEAIDNIQKNAEIARNLEDSFSSPMEHAHLSHIPMTELTPQETSSGLKNADTLDMLANKNSLNDEKLNFETKVANQPFHEEMKATASEIKESKLMTEHELKPIPRNDMPVKPFEESPQDGLFRTKSDLLGQKIHTETHKEPKSSDFDSSLKRPMAVVLGKEMEVKESSAKSAELIKMDVETNKLKQSDDADKVLISANSKPTSTMKSAEVNHDLKQHNVHEILMEVDSKALHNNLKNSKSVSFESDDTNMMARASEHVSAVDQKKAELQTDSLTHEKIPEEHQGMDKKMEELNQQTMTSFKSDPDIMRKIHLHNAAAKSGDQVAHMSEQVGSKVLAPGVYHHTKTDLTAKMVEHFDADHQHQLHNFHPQAKNWQPNHMSSMKNSAVQQSIADLPNSEMQRVVSKYPHKPHHFPGQHQPHFSGQAHHPQIHHPSHFGHTSHNTHHGSWFKAAEPLTVQEKAAEIDNAVQSTLQVNTNELSGKTALEHNANWKQQQQMGAARGAYGSYGLGAGVGAIGASGLAGGSSGGLGALGVFPHANTGGCAIPLLLSCSPSVVSGSLAKSHSGYGAPAYRSGDNFNFHTKRDTNKSNEITADKAQRTSTNAV